MQKTMLFIYNPKAGAEEIRLHLFELLHLFTRNDFLVTAHPTLAKRDAFETTLQYGEQYEYLVCAGGDGTLNEVIDGLMLLQKKPKLGYLPCGTTNDFATTLGLPKDLLLAAKNVCDGSPMPVDIGKFGDDYFSYVAAFGLFTDVSYDTDQSMKNLLGHAAYMLEGVKRLANIQSYRCTVQIGKKKTTNDFTFGMVSNSNSIGGFRFPTKEEALLDDGQFEVMLVKKITRFSQVPEVISMLAGGGGNCDALITYRADSISFSSDQALKWTLDGEYGGSHTHVNIENLRQAVEIIVPAKNDLTVP